MNSNRNASLGPITRREALAGFAAALAAAAVPGRSRAFASGSRTEPGECIWFPRENGDGLYDAYAVELQPDGTLWLEHDDGYLHAFSPGEWSLRPAADCHRLWLRETEAAWQGYDCLTESEAAEQLEIA